MGPPIPGQSRSLLNFAPHGIKQEFCASPAPVSSPKNIVPKSGMENAAVSSGSSKNNYNIRAATATTTSAMATSSQAVAPKSATAKIAAAAKAGGAAVTSFSSDHDYFNNFQAINENSILVKSKVGLEEGPAPMKLVVASKRNNTMTSYIEEDAPAQGYGPGKMADNTVVEERRINVTRGGAHLGMRTVVLHVPKDIK